MSTQKDIETVVNELDLEGWLDLYEDFGDALKAAMKASGGTFLTNLGITDPDMFSRVNQKALDYAQERGAELVGMHLNEAGELVASEAAEWSITEGTRSLLRDTISAAIKQGMGAGELQTAIVDSYAFSADRALCIARTELQMAHQYGALAAAKESGVIQGKKVILGTEHDQDDECDDNLADGVIGLDDSFSSGDDVAPFHPNCSCDIDYVPIEDKE